MYQNVKFTCISGKCTDKILYCSVSDEFTFIIYKECEKKRKEIAINKVFSREWHTDYASATCNYNYFSIPSHIYKCEPNFGSNSYICRCNSIGTTIRYRQRCTCGKTIKVHQLPRWLNSLWGIGRSGTIWICYTRLQELVSL